MKGRAPLSSGRVCVGTSVKSGALASPQPPPLQ